jgi:hypothetical protein
MRIGSGAYNPNREHRQSPESVRSAIEWQRRFGWQDTILLGRFRITSPNTLKRFNVDNSRSIRVRLPSLSLVLKMSE